MNLDYSIKQVAEIVGVQYPSSADVSQQIRGVSTDTRTLKKGDLFFALKGEHFDGDAFVEQAFERGAAAAVTRNDHPGGICLIHPNPLKALQSFAASHRTCMPARVIAITGSCGKTTAKDMAAEVLGSRYSVVKTPGNLNNDIGCPLSLLTIDKETKFAIIEMGANHKGEIAQLCTIARPSESSVTMVGPAHLEGFGSIEGVAQAKSEIMEALPPDGWFYVNVDDPRCAEMGRRFTGRKVYFGKSGDVVLKSISYTPDGDMLLDIHPIGPLRLPLAVKAHSYNVLLAVAIGLHHGIQDFEEPLRAACRAAVRFKIIKAGTAVILDDTYNANPASMKAALEALFDYPGQRKIAVLGDMFELGNEAERFHREVGEAAGRFSIDWVIALGENASSVADAAGKSGAKRTDIAESHQAIADLLTGAITAGDVILIKGSRGMKMETLTDLLVRALSRQQENEGRN